MSGPRNMLFISHATPEDNQFALRLALRLAADHTIQNQNDAAHLITRTTLSATLGAFLGTTPFPASAEDVYTPPFTLEKRGAAKNIDRYGEFPAGAVIRGSSNPRVVKTR